MIFYFFIFFLYKSCCVFFFLSFPLHPSWGSLLFFLFFYFLPILLLNETGCIIFFLAELIVPILFILYEYDYILYLIFLDQVNELIFDDSDVRKPFRIENNKFFVYFAFRYITWHRMNLFFIELKTLG